MTTHSQGAVENPRRMLFLYITLSALMACSAISTDLYLPGLPSIESQMGGNIELTITGFLIGFAIAQLIWGPVSDRIGRKIPLVLGMAIFAVGSAGCALLNHNRTGSVALGAGGRCMRGAYACACYRA